jgi:hypothetical protein
MVYLMEKSREVSSTATAKVATGFPSSVYQARSSRGMSVNMPGKYADATRTAVNAGTAITLVLDNNAGGQFREKPWRPHLAL